MSALRRPARTWTTYIDAAGKRVWRERHFEAELVDAFLQPSIAAENNFVLKQGRQPIPHIFRASPTTPWPKKPQVRDRLPSGNRVLEHLDIAMKTDHNMRDAHRLDNGHQHRAFDHVAGEVRAPWVVQINVIVGDVPAALAERRAKLGQEGVAIPTGRRGGGLGGRRVGGHDTQPLFAASIQDGCGQRQGTAEATEETGRLQGVEAQSTAAPCSGSTRLVVRG